MLALLAVALNIPSIGIEDSYAQMDSYANLPSGAQEELKPTLEIMAESFKNMTKAKRKVMGGMFELNVPTIEDYFESQLPQVFNQMGVVQGKLFKKSMSVYLPDTPPEKLFYEEVNLYLSLYYQMVRVFIQSMHNKGNSVKDYLEYWPVIEGLKLRLHENNYANLSLKFEEFKIERNTEKGYFEIGVSQYQIMAFEADSLKHIETPAQYARSVHFHALQSLVFMHLDLNSYSPTPLPAENVLGGSCAADSFLTFQNSTSENMLNLPIYKESKNFQTYINFYLPYTVMFAKAAIDSGIFNEQFGGNFIEHLQKKVPQMKKFLEKHVFPRNKEENKSEKDQDLKKAENYTEFVKNVKEGMVDGYRKLLLEGGIGQNLFSQAIRAGDEINHELIYEKTFQVAYDTTGVILDNWIDNVFDKNVDFEDRVKHFNEILGPIKEASMEFYNIKESQYRKAFSEELDKIEGLKHLKNHNTLAEYIRNRKVEKTYFLAKDAMPSAYFLNMINDDYLGIHPEDGSDLIQKLQKVRTPSLLYKDECSLDKCSLEDFQNLQAKLPLALKNAQKVLPVDVTELNELVEKKVDLPRFGRLYTTIKYDKKGQKLWDYFQNKIRERALKYKKEILKEHDLEEFITIAEESSDKPLVTETYFYKKVQEVLPKEKRIEILWKSAVEEAKKIRIGFVRRKICENIDHQKANAEDKFKQAKDAGSKRLEKYTTEVDHYNKLFTRHKCDDREAIEQNYMDDGEIAEMAKALDYEMYENMIQSFLFDPFEKARDMLAQNNYGNKQFDFSSLEQSLKDPSNSLGNKEIKGLESLTFTPAYEQELVEIVPEERFRKGWWAENWLGLLNIVDALLIPGDAIRDPDWSNWWYKIMGDDWDWSFGKLSTYGHREYHYQTEKEFTLDMQQQYAARELMKTLMNDDSYLFGESQLYIFKDATEAKEKPAAEVDFEGLGIVFGSGDDEDKGKVNDESSAVDLTKTQKADIDINQTLVKRVETEKESDDDLLSFIGGALENADKVKEYKNDEYGFEDNVVMDNKGDFEAHPVVNLVDTTFAKQAIDTLKESQNKFNKLLVNDSIPAQADAVKMRSDSSSRMKMDSTANKMSDEQAKELQKALGAVDPDSTEVVDPRFKTNLALPIDEQVAKNYADSIAASKRVATFSEPQIPTVSNNSNNGHKQIKDESSLTEEKIEESLSEDPLTQRLRADQEAFSNELKGIKPQREGKFATFTGDPAIFEQKDMLELVKVDKVVIDNLNYLINHYSLQKMDARGKPYENLGETFDQMIKLYGLFEVVEMDAPLDEFDFAPTLLEQYYIANMRVRMAMEGSRLLGLTDVALKYDFIPTDTKKMDELLGLNKEEANKKNRDMYIDRSKISDEKYDERVFILRLAQNWHPGKENLLKGKIHDYLDKAIENIQGKLADFCEADPINYRDNDAFSHMFEQSGGVRKYLYSAQNTQLDPMQRKLVEKDIDPEVAEQSLTSTQKLYEMWDYIGISIFIISILLAGVFAIGSGVGIPAFAALSSKWGLLWGMSSTLTGAASWLAPMQLIMAFYFFVPNYYRLIHCFEIPAQIEYQKTLMSTQIFEPTGGSDFGIASLENLERMKSEYIGKKFETAFAFAIDSGFVIYTISVVPKFLGMKSAKIMAAHTGTRFDNVIHSVRRYGLRKTWSRWKIYRQKYAEAVKLNERTFWANGKWHDNHLRLPESTA